METVIGVFYLVPCLLLALIGASEIRKVLLGDISLYPFGSEDAGFMYTSSRTYLLFMALDLLTSVGFVICFFLRDRSRLIYRVALLAWPAYIALLIALP